MNLQTLLGGRDVVSAPQGQVRVGGARLPLRTITVGNALVPIPWEAAHEQDFRAWWSGFARKNGYAQHPDHDRHAHDWRGLWWLGFRGFDRQGLRHDVRYAPNLRRARRGQRPAVAPTEEQIFSITRTL